MLFLTHKWLILLVKPFFRPENFGSNGSIRRALHPEGNRTSLVQTFPLEFSGKRREIAGMIRDGAAVPDRYVNLLKICEDPALADAGEHLLLAKKHSESEQDGSGKQVKPTGRTKQLSLLFNKNPIFASEYPALAAETARKISFIVEKMKQKHGDDFTAVSVAGSLSKGGWQKVHGNPYESSDVDFIVVGKHFGLVDEFRDELKKADLTPCGHYSFFSDQEKLPGKFMLFTGWLFGRDLDRERIYRMQYEAIKNMSNYNWRVIANQIHDTQLYVDKLGARLNLNKNEISTLKAIRCLQSVPPYTKQDVLDMMKKHRRYSKYFKQD